MPYKNPQDNARNMRRKRLEAKHGAQEALQAVQHAQARDKAATILQAMPEEARYQVIEHHGGALVRLLLEQPAGYRPRYALAAMHAAEAGDFEILAALEQREAREMLWSYLKPALAIEPALTMLYPKPSPEPIPGTSSREIKEYAGRIPDPKWISYILTCSKDDVRRLLAERRDARAAA